MTDPALNMNIRDYQINWCNNKEPQEPQDRGVQKCHGDHYKNTVNTLVFNIKKGFFLFAGTVFGFFSEGLKNDYP